MENPNLNKWKPKLNKLLYLVVGVWGVHLLHLARFFLVKWTAISAFPDYEIGLRTSLSLSLLLLPLSIATMFLINRYRHVWVFILCFLVTELASQSIGRSLIKFVIDIGIWGIIAGNFVVSHLYSRAQTGSATETTLKILHSEILGILRTTVNVCLFAIGTLGITVVSRLITQYFDEELGQGTAWCYIGGVLYISLGMVYFLIIPLYNSMVKVRERIK
jgi:small-conductance mechanosensitive channel